MLEKSENTTSSQLTSFAADSRVRMSRSLKRTGKDSTEIKAGCGLNIYESFGKFDPHTHSLKTYQTSLFVDCSEFSLTLPPSGTMRNGRLYERPLLDYRNDGSDFSLLPTPRATDPFRLRFSLKSIYKVCTRTHVHFSMELPYFLKICNIPIHRYPNIYEWIMGFPLNYLKLKQQSKDTETQSVRQSQNGSESES